MIQPVLTRYNLVSEALQLGPREIVALTGGGGKTSLLFQLARELQARGPVITTTTTKIALPEPEQSSCVILTRDHPQWENLVRIGLRDGRHVTVAHFRYGGAKLKGHEGQEMEELLGRELAPYVIIEADGARQKPLKAPRHDEPPVPKLATLVVGLIGWDSLGRELVEANVHRTAIFRQLLGLQDERILVTGQLIERWVAHPQGLRKHVPPEARFVLFLNQCDNTERREEAIRLASAIVCSPGSPCRRALVGSIRNGTFISVQTPNSGLLSATVGDRS